MVFRGAAGDAPAGQSHQENTATGEGLSCGPIGIQQWSPKVLIPPGIHLLIEPFVGGVELGDNNIENLHLSYGPVPNPGMNDHAHLGF